jgi:predicted metal-dependent hydrolase
VSAIEVRRSAQARRLRLSIDPASGTVRLTLPRRAPLKPALAWAQGQSEWIARQRAQLPESKPFVPGAIISVDGEDLELRHDPHAPRRPQRSPGCLTIGGPAEGFSARAERWLKQEALRVLEAETRDLAATIRVSVTQVGVGDPRSRWGSCSSSGAIRYSWRLILAPPFVRRATVAHEVAHRVHMNHSPEFHALAASLTDGDPQESRAWLRAHGAALHWYGRSS